MVLRRVRVPAVPVTNEHYFLSFVSFIGSILFEFKTTHVSLLQIRMTDQDQPLYSQENEYDPEATIDPSMPLHPPELKRESSFSLSFSSTMDNKVAWESAGAAASSSLSGITAASSETVLLASATSLLLQTSSNREEVDQYIGQLPGVKQQLVRCVSEGHYVESVKQLFSVLTQRIIALEREKKGSKNQKDQATQTQIEHIRCSR